MAIIAPVSIPNEKDMELTPLQGLGGVGVGVGSYVGSGVGVVAVGSGNIPNNIISL